MPTARGWLAVAVVDDLLYAIGGSPGLMLPFMTINEQYTLFGYSVSDSSDGSAAEIPLTGVLIVAFSVAAIVTGAGLLVYFKKRNKELEDQA